VEWPQSFLCEQAFLETRTLLDLVRFAKQRAEIPFEPKQYTRVLPHELKVVEKKAKKGGGGFFFQAVEAGKWMLMTKKMAK